MASHQVTTLITYRNPGTQPPVFVAGSFSDPEWHPQAMEYAIDTNGDFVFTRAVTVEAGSRFQYKFKIGSGDWWALDENGPTGEPSISFILHRQKALQL